MIQTHLYSYRHVILYSMYLGQHNYSILREWIFQPRGQVSLLFHRMKYKIESYFCQGRVLYGHLKRFYFVMCLVFFSCNAFFHLPLQYILNLILEHFAKMVTKNGKNCKINK